MIIEMSGGSPTQATGRSCFISQGLLEANQNRLTCSNFCSALRVRDGSEKAFFYFTWRLLYDAGVMFNYEGKTSGLKNLQIDSLLMTKWSFPPNALARQFDDLFRLIQEGISRSKSEIFRLISLRDFLLPLLMNGQVSIKD